MCRIMVVSSICRMFVMLALAAAVGALWESSCPAQDKVEMPGAERFKEMEIVGGELLTLTADGRIESLEGDVELLFIAASEKDENVTLKADRLDFFYDDKTDEPTRDPTPALVVAKGNMSLATQSHLLRADELRLSMAENRAELRGSPEATGKEYEYKLRGEVIVYDMDEGRIQVRKPRGTIVTPKKEDAKQKEREKEGNSP